MQLFLEAVDVWLFRDGRPFDALSDHRAESLFPPYPTVIQGAIRSRHLVVKGVDLRDRKAIEATVGTATDYKDLRLRGPFIARRQGDNVELYFPQPADAVTVSKYRHTLKPASAPEAPHTGVLTSAPTDQLLGLENKPEKGESGLWLSESKLQRYLDGGTVAGIPAAGLFVREDRFGIGLDNDKRVVKEGALYEVEFIRPCEGVGLLVEVEGYDGWPTSGMMQVGGEGRGARFTQVTAAAWPAPPDPLPDRFKVYFATPTYFENGWQPERQPEDWSRFFDGGVTLQAAALGRYESVGGFDLASKGNGHKPARRYVPAGSVYYFQAKGTARLKPELIQNAVTDFGAEIGFGQILIERW